MQSILLGDLRLKKQVFYATVALSGLVMAGCGCSKAGDNVAMVDDTPITTKAYHSYLEHMPTVKVVQNQDSAPQEGRVWASLGFQALQSLINQQLLLEVAKDEGVVPTAADIDKDLTFHHNQQANFVSNLQQQGLTLEDIRDQLRLELATQNILTKGITVTSLEAKKFIQDNPQQFSTPAQAQLLYIVVQDDKNKQAADKELASGQSFGQVAMHYSVAPDARQTQGRFRETVITKMAPALQDLVAHTPELKTTDWIKDQAMWVKFYVEKKQPAKPVPVDDTLIETVRRQMAIQKGTRTTNLNKLIFDKMRAAKIQVIPSYLAAPWTSFSKQVATAAAQSTNPPATGGSRAPRPAGAPPKR